jgi:hypothetical protein
MLPALHGPLVPLLLFAAAVVAAVLLAGAWIIHWWLKGRRGASSATTSLRLADYETSEERDVHDQRRGGAV